MSRYSTQRACPPGRTQTGNLSLSGRVLYPFELRAVARAVQPKRSVPPSRGAGRFAFPATNEKGAASAEADAAPTESFYAQRFLRERVAQPRCSHVFLTPITALVEPNKNLRCYENLMDPSRYVTPNWGHCPTVYHGDAREVLPTLSVSAVVSDPPYGLAGEFDAIHRPGRYGRAGGRVAGDEAVALAEWLEGFVAERRLPAVLFGMWQRAPIKPRRQLVWDKGNFGLSGTDLPWISSHEVAWVFGGGWVGTKRGTVYRSSRQQNAEHPTQKPVDLMQWIVASAPPDWVICDPFAGSGTTLVAAKNLGRKSVGIELEGTVLRHHRLASFPERLGLWGQRVSPRLHDSPAPKSAFQESAQLDMTLGLLKAAIL